MFKLGRVPNSEGVFKIRSSSYPSLVLSLSEGVCSSSTNIVFLRDGNNDYQKWKIESGGTIENIKCKGMAIDISGQSQKNDDWSQMWNVMSDDTVLLEAGAGGSSTQIWSPVFIEPGYDLALHPGFPGDVGSNSCLSSTEDRALAKSAMHSCDNSMSLLLGSQISLGTLKATADLIHEKGTDRMPGYCCLDVATDSGERVECKLLTCYFFHTEAHAFVPSQLQNSLDTMYVKPLTHSCNPLSSTLTHRVFCLSSSTPRGPIVLV